MCSVFLPAEDRTVSIAADHLQPVQPSRGDRVKVIMGETLTYIYFLTCSSRFLRPNYLFQILNIPHASTKLFWVYDPRNLLPKWGFIIELFSFKISLNFTKRHQRKKGKLPIHFNVHQSKGFRNVTKAVNRVLLTGS